MCQKLGSPKYHEKICTWTVGLLFHERVYMSQPPNYENLGRPNYVYHLKKAIHGFQAPKAWYEALTDSLIQMGLSITEFFFSYTTGNYNLYLIYVDDILLTSVMNHSFNKSLPLSPKSSFLKYLGLLDYFLAMRYQGCKNSLFHNRSTYYGEGVTWHSDVRMQRRSLTHEHICHTSSWWGASITDGNESAVCLISFSTTTIVLLILMLIVQMISVIAAWSQCCQRCD